jgi:signal transduction histidine kinase
MTDREPTVARKPRRRSLQARLGWWMAMTTIATVLVFACVVYALVRAEADEGTTGAPREDAREQVLMAMLIAGPACLLLSILGARLSSRRALAPIDAVITQANAMTAEDVRMRLAVPEQNDELRDLVLALNAMLTRLDEGFAALGSYASTASHELRTPLAVIISELEIALRRPRPVEEWERVARTSLDEMKRLSELVEALLELARAGGASSVSHGVFELRARIDQTLASLGSAAASAGVALVPAADGAEIWLDGDPELLMNAVRELVRNAARYTPRGSCVRLRVERHEARALVHVDDDGPGVPPAERTAIFAPFVRGARGGATDAERGGPRGLGLGLAIAKRSVETLAGTIRVGASPDGGARFTIDVPVSDALSQPGVSRSR